MNSLTDINYIKGLLKSHGFKPNEIMGQNFLIDELVLVELVEAAQLKKTDTVLEVGPGLGVLTAELLKKVGRVIAVEKDIRLFEILKKDDSLKPRLEFDGGAARFGKRLTSDGSQDVGRKTIRAALPNNHEHISIINQDILKFNISENISEDYKVVANIPYYLTSKLIQNLLEATHKPSLMILMLQKEVGERIVATPGELSVLAISVQLFADVQIIKQVNKKCFWPEPKVDSVIIRIEPKEKYPEVQDHKFFFRIIKSAFAGKRKQIHNTLSSGLNIPEKEITEILLKSKISPTARPQELSIEQWISLYKIISNSKS